MAQRADNAPTRDGSLIPPRNADLPNTALTSDAVASIDLTDLGFIPLICEVRSDIDFQWSTGEDPAQGTGPWLDAGALHRLPVNGAAALKVRKRTTGGANGTVYTKAIGAD